MNRIAKFCIAASASALCAQATAQGMYKCKDAAGKITYTGSECHLLGLTSAGEITGRASVTPALEAPPAQRAPRPAPAAAPPAAPPDAASGQSDPGGDLRCFAVKTARGGTVTRCNAGPDTTN